MLRSLISLLIGLAIFAAAFAAHVAMADADATATAPEFVPPANAKPAKRMGGEANRCSEDPELYVSVLAPADTVGFTTRERPTLYWYLSKATDDPVEIAITDLRDKSARPVLELSLDAGVKQPGVQRLDLAEHGRGGDAARLAPGGEYEWVVEVITSEKAGSRNASAVARITRLDAASAPAAPPNTSNKSDLAAFFAKRGVWYDYIAALLDAVRAAPEDKSLLARLGASLKKQRLVWREDGNIDEFVK